MERIWKTLEHVDWDLLHKQKMALITSPATVMDPELREATDGLINFLDSLLDEAEDRGLFDYPETEEEAE